jgi:hypothetical protein
MNMRRKFLVSVLTLISLAIAGGSSVAQAQGQQRVAELDKESAVKKTLAGLLAGTGVQMGETPSLSDVQTYTQIQVHWQGAADSKSLSANSANALERQPGSGVVTLLKSVSRDGILPRERSLELSTDHILVVAVDEKQALRWWKVRLDPRLVRSETVAASGEIHGEQFYRSSVDFKVEYPADPAIKQLRFYQPVWTGTNFRLELISTLAIP